MDQTLLTAMTERLEQDHLPCAQAFAIARRLGVDPLAVGQAANDAGIRISQCQLGLFGYGPKAEGKHKTVRPMDAVPPDLSARLGAVSEAGDVSCEALWQVASQSSVSRLDASSAAEALGLHVSVCQLGCFPRPVKG